MTFGEITQNLGANSPWTTVHNAVLASSCLCAAVLFWKAWSIRTSKPMAFICVTLASLSSALAAAVFFGLG
jgi:hypothetical protein